VASVTRTTVNHNYKCVLWYKATVAYLKSFQKRLFEVH